MERIEQIINAADCINVNRDLIAIKSYVLGDLASDLREEARGVIENSPDSFRLTFHLDGDIDIARLIQQIEDCIRMARESLYDLVTKTRTMLAQAQNVHSALRDARRRDVARAPEQFEFRDRDFAVPELIDRLHGREDRRVVASPTDKEPESRPIDEEPES
ncbi:uncharacterized protein LOC115241424 [Formica exsecta]|uniref:uncharacterized protein LOC115241424 n=1 Tax=Formica exsecta TaxID=72781 RepID=UPI001142508F|nr:uncharacterized protein LOC115241424 [Formica exsecta]